MMVLLPEMETRWPMAGVFFTLRDRKSTRLNSSHSQISYAVFCLKKKKNHNMIGIKSSTRVIISKAYTCINETLLLTIAALCQYDNIGTDIAMLPITHLAAITRRH